MQSIIQCQTCDPNEAKMITDNEAGEVICSKCGIVAARSIEYTKKIWNTADDEHLNTSNGYPSSLARHDKGLSTTIARTQRDSTGHIIDSRMQVRFNRLRNWDRRSQIHKSSRNLSIAFRQLDALKDKLNLPPAVIEKAAYIYRKVQEDGLVKGRKINTVLGASLYVACREFSIPRTIMEVINANNGKYNETSRVYRQIVLHLDQKIPQQNIYQLIEKVGRNADLDERNIRMALQLMKRLEITGFSAGRDPMGIAGAIIYISLPYSNKKNMKKGITQKQISDAAGVSEVTIRAVAKQISKKLRLE